MQNKFGNIFKSRKHIAIIAAIFILIIFCFTLTACDPGSYYLKQEDLTDIVSVEVINYDNPEQKHFKSWVPDHEADLKPFDNSKVSVLETLDENNIINFVDELCGYHILYKYYGYDSPNGTCLKLTRSNGNFLIVSCNENRFAGYIGEFSTDGEIIAFIGCFSNRIYFEALVNDYFQTKI